MVPTGVKYLHSKAEKSDLGVYFEANGHGTILYLKTKIEELKAKINNPAKEAQFDILLSFLKIANPVIGDAITNFLLAEAALMYLGIDLITFSKFYTDLPSRTIKAPVKDKLQFIPNEDEQRLLKPVEVQEFIDNACSKNKFGRAFVRPSGTEDILRIYAEAETLDMADKLSEEIKDFLKRYA